MWEKRKTIARNAVKDFKLINIQKIPFLNKSLYYIVFTELVNNYIDELELYL